MSWTSMTSFELPEDAAAFSQLNSARTSALAATALRSGQQGVLEILAQRSSVGRISLANVLELAHSVLSRPDTKVPGTWHVQTLSNLGLALAGFATTDPECTDALAVLHLARRVAAAKDGDLPRTELELALARHLGKKKYVKRNFSDGTASPRVDPKTTWVETFDSVFRTADLQQTVEQELGDVVPVDSGRDFDVHVVGDFRSSSAGAVELVREARALASSGLRVAVTSNEALGTANEEPEPLHRELLDAIGSGEVALVQWAEQATTELLLVREPSLFSWAAEDMGTAPQRVVLTAQSPVFDPLGNHCVFNPVRVTQACAAMFGVEPEWLPADSETAAALGLAGAQKILPEQYLHVGRPSTSPVRKIVGRPVVGFVRNERWPAYAKTSNALADMLPKLDWDVRYLGETSLVGPLKFDPALTSDEEFFNQLDFLLLSSSQLWGPIGIRTAVEAMSRGCLVVADEKMAHHLDTDALLSPQNLVERLAELTADTEGTLALKRAARSWATEKTDPERFVRAIRALLG